MATSLSSFRPATVLCSSDNRRKPPPAAAPSSASWWTPIFGWSSDPDYIPVTPAADKTSEAENAKQQARSRFTPGCFTEEKAKQLRMKTLETSSFHDIMYHSAIASRLASDVPGRRDL